MGIAELLLWPALACFVLTGIHAYLGLHVVERGVIFVDLSLAQVAALGTTVAFLCGFGLHGPAAYAFSLGFALSAAALFALTRARSERIPQEAVIGIVYAVSAAAAILIMDRAPEGAEHIKHLLVGNILTVSPHEVAKIAVLYAGVGAVHWFYRKPFLLISTDEARARREGLSVRAWDFLFYASFALVVTSSVQVAGVLLVFAYLVIPSVGAMLFCERVGTRLAFGWGLGLVGSMAGIAASFFLDLPTGAAIVVTFGALLAALALARRALAA